MSRGGDGFDADGLTGGRTEAASVFPGMPHSDDRPEVLIRAVYIQAIFELKAHMGLLDKPAVKMQMVATALTLVGHSAG